MSRPPQASLFTQPPHRSLVREEYGGTLGHGLRKRERPMDPRRPLHVILRSSRAKGAWSLLQVRHERRIKHLVHSTARQHGLRVFRFANAGNHLHLVVQGRSRKAYQDYLRTLSGLVARAVTGARKGKPVGRFWDALAYSRVLERGRDLRNLDFYVVMSELEGLGAWSRSRDVAQASPRAGPV